MSKPDFYIVRHAESAGNADPSYYAHTPDHRVPLTEKGVQQAQTKREELSKLLSPYKNIYSWVSPYTRTQQTAENMFPKEDLKDGYTVKVRQDPRIREQEWGIINGLIERDRLVADRKRVGHFFYRFPNGESGADVYDRVSHFLESVFRNHQNLNVRAANVLFTHGLTARVLAMRLLHVGYEEFEAWANPNNCQIIAIKHTGEQYEFKDGYGFSKWK